MKQFFFTLTLSWTAISYIMAADLLEKPTQRTTLSSTASSSSAASAPVAEMNGLNLASSKSLRITAQELDREGRLLAAAQAMDKHLRLSDAPSISDLCFALKLNQQLTYQDRLQRTRRLADQISRGLKVADDLLIVDFPESSWTHFHPYLTYMIEQTIADPTYETRTFSFIVMGESFGEYCDWNSMLMSRYKYPIGISGGNLGRLSGKKANGFHDCRMSITINNKTLAEEKSRKTDAYRYYEGELDPTRVNSNTFHNLMVRARLTPEELDTGQYKSSKQKPVFVKPLELQSASLEHSITEVEEVIFSTLRKSMHPFVVLVLNLKADRPFPIQDLWRHNNGSNLLSLLNRATIIETQEKRIYLCYENDQRNTLELHGLSVQEAEGRFAAFITEKYYNFEEDCQIIPGKGNHANPQGASGILNSKLNDWIQSPGLKPMIASCRKGDGGGIFLISLAKPISVTLDGVSIEADVIKIAEHILQEDRAGRNRLKIQTAANQPIGYVDKVMSHAVFNLFHKSNFSKAINFGPSRFTWSESAPEEFK